MQSTKATRILIPASDRKEVVPATRLSWSRAQDLAKANRFRSLTAAREEAVSAFLAGINGQGHAQQILRLRGESLAEATQRNEQIHEAGTAEAILRYGGPLYGALAARTLPSAAAKRLADEVVIVSPLLGLVAPRDLIPDYRCPLAPQIPGFGSLHAFWKPRVGPILDRISRGRTVFSFLPRRMQALWVPRPQQAFAWIEWCRHKGGGARPENAGAARLSGELVRAMLEAGWTESQDLCQFVSSEGHRFDERQSRLDGPHHRLVFVR